MTLHQLREYAYRAARLAGLKAEPAREVAHRIGDRYRQHLAWTPTGHLWVMAAPQELEQAVADEIRPYLRSEP